MTKTKILISLFLLHATCYMLYAPAVQAQQIDLSLTPPLTELYMQPDKSATLNFQLENRGDPVIVRMKVLSIEPQGMTGDISVKDELEGPLSFSLNNGSFSNQSFFLTTGDTEELEVTVRTAEGAPEADYYFALLAETEPPPATEGTSQARIKTQVGSTLLITVTKTGRRDVKAKIAKLEVGQRVNGKMPVVLTVENSGKNFGKVTGDIRVSGLGVKKVFKIMPLNVLAQSSRLVTAEPSVKLNCTDKEEKDLCKKPYSLAVSGFFFGKYTINAKVSLEGGASSFASTSFVVVPVKFIALLIVIAVILVIVLRKKLMNMLSQKPNRHKTAKIRTS